MGREEGVGREERVGREKRAREKEVGGSGECCKCAGTELHHTAVS